VYNNTATPHAANNFTSPHQSASSLADDQTRSAWLPESASILDANAYTYEQWGDAIGLGVLRQAPPTQPVTHFDEDFTAHFTMPGPPLSVNMWDTVQSGAGDNSEDTPAPIGPLLRNGVAAEHVSRKAPKISPNLPSPAPDTRRSGHVNKRSRRRSRLVGTVIEKEIMRNEPGKIQGIVLTWQGKAPNSRKMNDAEKEERKRRMQLGSCCRCRQLKQLCSAFKESPYLPCESCRKSNPTSITTACVLEASLLNITLFRMGPPIDNPYHPLNFFTHRQDILNGITDGTTLQETLDLDLMQDDIGQVLNLTVSMFSPLPGDKLAYEGIGEHGPYRLEMPPYCISDIKKAAQSLIIYMRKAKRAYLKCFIDRSSPLLFNTFKMAVMCDFKKRPMVSEALDIWTTTRLIERTWKIRGKETFGIHPYEGRSDPWRGFVPVTPIMDQQLDQVVIREVLVPRRDQLLNKLKDKVYDEAGRKSHAFEVYLTLFILLNNAEMQIAAEREFAQRYGFSGRFGPRGKYMDVEAHFHAARTMLGHFHYICRASCLLTNSHTLLGNLGIADKERKYLDYVRGQAEQQKPHFSALIQRHRYESSMYFCHQMFSNEWNPGPGHIEEIPETPATT
jgi:hypothetical protein